MSSVIRSGRWRTWAGAGCENWKGWKEYGKVGIGLTAMGVRKGKELEGTVRLASWLRGKAYGWTKILSAVCAKAPQWNCLKSILRTPSRPFQAYLPASLPPGTAAGSLSGIQLFPEPRLPLPLTPAPSPPSHCSYLTTPWHFPAACFLGEVPVSFLCRITKGSCWSRKCSTGA